MNNFKRKKEEKVCLAGDSWLMTWVVRCFFWVHKIPKNPGVPFHFQAVHLAALRDWSSEVLRLARLGINPSFPRTCHPGGGWRWITRPHGGYVTSLEGFLGKTAGVGGYSGPTSCDTSQCLFFLEFKVEKMTEKWSVYRTLGGNKKIPQKTCKTRKPQGLTLLQVFGLPIASYK